MGAARATGGCDQTASHRVVHGGGARRPGDDAAGGGRTGCAQLGRFRAHARPGSGVAPRWHRAPHAVAAPGGIAVVARRAGGAGRPARSAVRRSRLRTACHAGAARAGDAAAGHIPAAALDSARLRAGALRAGHRALRRHRALAAESMTSIAAHAAQGGNPPGQHATRRHDEQRQ